VTRQIFLVCDREYFANYKPSEHRSGLNSAVSFKLCNFLNQGYFLDLIRFLLVTRHTCPL